MIDLSSMKTVEIDDAARVARVQPGVTWAELDAASQERGLATTGADTPSVGVAGSTLGGGLGHLQRLCGLTCDNLLAAEVVVADGRVLRAAEDDNEDLFWAIRGGGGNFGVVTSFTLALHPIRTLVGGVVIHPLERAGQALRLYREACASAPDELALMAMFVTAPPTRSIPTALHRSPILMLGAAHFGAEQDADRDLRTLRTACRPVRDFIRAMTYVELQKSPMPVGLQHYGRGEFLRDLDDGLLDALVEGAVDAVSPFMMIELNQLGGALGRVPNGATAFGHRGAVQSLGIHCMWPPHGGRAVHVDWVETLWRAASPSSAGGAYVNQLGDEGPERVRAAYGEDNFGRLAAIKAVYDPTNLFRMNQNVPPAA
jgi:FAD/FMN-containing dehydrogenase